MRSLQLNVGRVEYIENELIVAMAYLAKADN